MPCASSMLLLAALLPATAVTISAAEAQQATQLPPVTVEKPQPKPKKAKAKAKTPSNVQPATNAAAEPAPSGTGDADAASAGQSKGLAQPLNTTSVSGQAISSKAPATNDAAALLGDVPGVSLYTSGGVSSLPVIDGLNDDRIKIVIDGAVTSAACANHMNPPLSYVDPAQVKKIDVFAGVTPVSAGGDSIAGTINIEKLPPQFADAGEGIITHATLTSFVRSNGNGLSTSGNVSAASNNLAIVYTGAWSLADNYEDGAGRTVGATEYEAQNHSLLVAARRNGDLYVLEGGIQHIPYQGFVNQWMDMTLNQSWYVNGRYEGKFGWGKLNLNAYYRDVRHEMNFLEDKPWGSMPMNVDGVDAGYSVKAEIPVSLRDTLRIGNEYHYQSLNDYWPPVGDMPGMMCCSTFLNVNHGTRNTFDTYAEWERKWTPQWTTLLGLRNDIVWMDTGDVRTYDPSIDDYAQELAFNAREHAKTDINFDMTALVRYEPNATHTLEAGYSRKTRSPSIYERYTWSQNDMGSQMISWFGDLNGYYGDINLDPEVAHRLSFTVDWHDAAHKRWDVKVTPYYTYVDGFITAAQRDLMMMGMFSKLQFVNHDAQLYGVDISGRLALGEVPGLGRFNLSGVIGYVHGEDLETDGPLYHMMPWNARLALEHKLGRWTNTVELQMVDDKTRVDADRLEPVTPGYALVNLRTSYQFEHLRFDFGVENLFDKQYSLPLGGIDFENYLPVSGMGRSFYAGVTMKF